MAPVLQGLSTFAIWILLRLPFLCKVALVVSYHLAHVANIVFVVLAGVFLRVLLQDLNDFTTAIERSALVEHVVLDRPGSFTSRDQWSHRSHHPWTSLHQQNPRHRAIPSTGPVTC